MRIKRLSEIRAPRRGKTTGRGRPQPLHEALAVGLGCDAVGYKAPSRPEWY